MKINCLTVNVLRNTLGDCTNNGVSARNDKLLIPCADGPWVLDTENGIPDNFCYIRKRLVYGNKIVYDIRPADVVDGKIVDRDGEWYMMGGNFAYSSDSRFSDMIGLYGAVAIHDRVEKG